MLSLSTNRIICQLFYITSLVKQKDNGDYLIHLYIVKYLDGLLSSTDSV